jgi:hypothetical protein
MVIVEEISTTYHLKRLLKLKNRFVIITSNSLRKADVETVLPEGDDNEIIELK